MSMAARFLWRLGLIWVCIASASCALGQMIPREDVDSIDARVLTAHRIVVGTITDLGPVSSNTMEQEVTVAVSETLKGPAEKSIRVQIGTWQTKPDFWMANSVRLLISTDKSGSASAQDCTDLGAGDLAVSRADFTFITDPELLLREVRELVRKASKAQAMVPLRPPKNDIGKRWLAHYGNSSRVDLLVPADARLEAWARRVALSKGSLEEREQAVGALRVFISPRNIELLENLLKDGTYVVQNPPEWNSGQEVRHYPLRQSAFYVLEAWDVKIPSPPFDEAVPRTMEVASIKWRGRISDSSLASLASSTKLASLSFDPSGIAPTQLPLLGRITRLTQLELPSQGIGDDQIAPLLRLTNLRTLVLSDNPIGDIGLIQLADLPNLKELNLYETEVTDDGIAALRRARPGLRITPGNAYTAIDNYARRGDIAGIKRILDRNPGAIEQKNRNQYGTPPLMDAVYDRQYEAARYLLERGAAVDGTNDWKGTPFEIACVQPRSDLNYLKLLLKYGANVNHPSDGGLTPLMEAMNPISQSNFALVRFLLAVGADPWQKANDGRLALDNTGAVNYPAGKMVADYMELRKSPPKLLTQSKAGCPRLVYRLAPGANLIDWTSAPIGRLSGPLQWTRSPSGRDFLGQFGRQRVTLKLTNLPKHGNVEVDIDLFIIGSWDGNGDGAGPDIMDISIPGVGTALHSTFFCNDEEDRTNLPMQSFPDPYPFGFHRAYTGAAEVKSLGYVERFPRSAVYRLRYVFAHGSPDLSIVFSGLTVPQDYVTQLDQDETWGIGSITVKTDGQ